MKYISAFALLLLISVSLSGQNSVKNVIDGNKAYEIRNLTKPRALQKSLEQKSDYDFQGIQPCKQFI